MHILFTAYEFVTEKNPCGGLGNYLANISTILAENGHDITILIMSNHNSRFEWKEHIEVVTFRYHYVEHLWHWEDYLAEILPIDNIVYINYGLAIRKKIEEIHKEKPIDIIQNNGDRLEAICRIREIPTIVRLSSVGEWYKQAYDRQSNMNDFRWMKTWNYRFFLYSLRRADAVYGPSQVIADFINQKAGWKVEVIESPFFLKECSNDENSENGLLKGKKYLFFFGRICALKGIYTIADAIYQILEEYPDLHFAFAGNLEEKKCMKELQDSAKQFRNRIIYLGNITERHALSTIIRNAEACVLPSRADNLPNACIESMGMGRIVIGTYGASFEQMIEDKKSGLLITRDSSEELIQAVRYLMAMSESDKAKMGSAARKRVEQMSPEKVYTQVITLYQKVIDQHKKG